MPVFFKIIVFLFLQQGAKVARDLGKPGMEEPCINWETVLLARPMILTIESDEAAVNELVNICSIYEKKVEVKQDYTSSSKVKAELYYASLKYADRDRMMNALSPMLLSRVVLEWKEL